VNVLGFLDYLRIAVADFNLDGNLDVAFSRSTWRKRAPDRGKPLHPPGKGNGTFGAAQTISGVTGASLSTGDLKRRRQAGPDRLFAEESDPQLH